MPVNAKHGIIPQTMMNEKKLAEFWRYPIIRVFSTTIYLGILFVEK